MKTKTAYKYMDLAEQATTAAFAVSSAADREAHLRQAQVFATLALAAAHKEGE